jgi:hypothetical protein
MWDCSKCAESIPDNFACCWNCGTTADGEPDPHFGEEIPRPAPKDVSRPFQFRLLGILATTTVLAAILGLGRLVDEAFRLPAGTYLMCVLTVLGVLGGGWACLYGALFIVGHVLGSVGQRLSGRKTHEGRAA